MPSSSHRGDTPLQRSSGVQLHITSLPSGRMGPDAFAFVDWLAAAGQSWWQVLPLHPPDRTGSPYKSVSAFAAWRGLLADPSAAVQPEEAAALRRRESDWIGAWEAHAGRRAVFDQVRFEREWGRLRAYAAARGVRLIGDVPFYVGRGSVDHRGNPELFRDDLIAGSPPDAFSPRGQLWGNPVYDWPALQRRGYGWWVRRLRRTFALYDLARLDHFRGFLAYWAVPAGSRDAAHGSWRRGPGRALFDAAAAELGPLPAIAENLGEITPPVERLREELGLPGMAVLQFAFERSAGNLNAFERHQRHGVVYTGTHDNDTLLGWWASRPRAERQRVLAALHAAGIEAEACRGAVRRVARRGVPCEPEPPRTVRARAAATAMARRPDGEGQPGVAWPLIRLALSSPCAIAIVQAQDVLGLGPQARMNVPGRASGNWRWRLAPGQLTDAHAKRLRAATAAAGRLA